MPQLVIMRHAKAESGSPDGTDFGRALKPEGREQARAQGQCLLRDGVVIDDALVSGARRTRETWAEIATSYPQTAVRFDDSLYSHGSDALASMVDGFLIANPEKTLLLVGHNPTVHELVVDFMRRGGASTSDLARLSRGYPTSSATVFDIDPAGVPRFQSLYRRPGAAD